MLLYFRLCFVFRFTDEIANQLSDSHATAAVCHPLVAPVVRLAAARDENKTVHVINTHDTTEPGELSLPAMCQDDGLAFPKDLQVSNESTSQVIRAEPGREFIYFILSSQKIQVEAVGFILPLGQLETGRWIFPLRVK